MLTLLTPQDLAQRWCVPLSSIYKMSHFGTGITPIKIGRRLRYRLTDVEAWEAANMVGATK